MLGPANLAAVRSEPCRNRHNVLFNDEDLAARELDLFRDAGGTTVVDLTLPDVGRDLAGLARIARRTGLHIVAGCGYYLEETHSPAVAESTIEELAERLVARCSCVNCGAACTAWTSIAKTASDKSSRPARLASRFCAWSSGSHLWKPALPSRQCRRPV